jgi:CO/xanthine dehydrogenase Mo-binding subunit
MTEQLGEELSRRSFVKGGGALVVGFSALGAFAGQARADKPVTTVSPTSLDAWIAVHADNTVTVGAGKLEYGQGTTTGLRQVAAEELDVSIAQIRWLRPETGVTPDQGGTYGSNGTTTGSPGIRAAAAYAKQTLLGFAAAQLAVPVSGLTVKDGVVSGGGKSVKYGDLLGGKLFNVTLPTTSLAPGVAPAKPVAQYTMVGTRVPRVDIPDKITGAFTYMQNVRIPDMLHGRVVRPRGQAAYGTGAPVLAVDESSIRKIPGARVVRKNDFVGVVAANEYDAIQAAAQLKVTWKEAPTLPGSGNLWKQMRAQDAAGQTTNAIRASAGDVGPAFASAAKTVSSTFTFGYQTHGPIGPNCAIADVKSGSAFVMCSTQWIQQTQYALGITLGMPSSQITVQYWDGAGTFGASGYDDVAGAAALMSQAVGKPVRVQFMRWDEHGYDTYGPGFVADVRAGIDASGKIVAYDHTAWAHPYVPYGGSGAQQTSRELSGQPIPTADIGVNGSVETTVNARYVVPNYRVTSKSVDPLKGYLMASFLRLPLGPQNAFMSEQMIDDLAHAANMDPVAFRRLNIDATSAAGSRALAVLDGVVSASGWKAKVAASSLSKDAVVTGRGLATWNGSGGQQAVVADVAVNRHTGKVTVKHLCCVQDAGLAINPASIEGQIMGNLVMGASRALVEEVKFSTKRVTGIDWATYPIMRFKDAPGVTAVLINRPDLAIGGAGEPTHGPPGAAIGNAVFDATGVRIKRWPMTPAHVRAALKAAGAV